MSWFSLTDEERAEWRQNPATQAFVAELRKHITDHKDDLSDLMYAADQDNANRGRSVSGTITGLEKAIAIIGADS